MNAVFSYSLLSVVHLLWLNEEDDIIEVVTSNDVIYGLRLPRTDRHIRCTFIALRTFRLDKLWSIPNANHTHTRDPSILLFTKRKTIQKFHKQRCCISISNDNHSSIEHRQHFYFSISKMVSRFKCALLTIRTFMQ